MKKLIKNLMLDELKAFMASCGQKPYRAQQLFAYLYEKKCTSFDAMLTLPSTLRDRLTKDYDIAAVTVREHLISRDGTEKFLFELHDGAIIESVIIYARARVTICLSTQVGCRYGCVFCMSGKRGFVRNLTPGEIADQVITAEGHLQKRITNIVVMGIGEPFDNYDHVMKALTIINHPDGLAIGARKITVSTSGLIPGIRKFTKNPLQINLSLSLHAATSELRSSLMPINKRYPLKRLIPVCKEYVETTGRIMTLEYLLLRGINDRLRDARALASLALHIRAKVNVLLMSPTESGELSSPREHTVNNFVEALEKARVNVTLRQPKGSDIHAACGQLVIKHRC